MRGHLLKQKSDIAVGVVDDWLPLPSALCDKFITEKGHGAEILTKENAQSNVTWLLLQFISS